MLARAVCVALLVGLASCADIPRAAQLNADTPELTLAVAQVPARNTLRPSAEASFPPEGVFAFCV